MPANTLHDPLAQDVPESANNIKSDKHRINNISANHLQNFDAPEYLDGIADRIYHPEPARAYPSNLTQPYVLHIQFLHSAIRTAYLSNHQATQAHLAASPDSFQETCSQKIAHEHIHATAYMDSYRCHCNFCTQAHLSHHKLSDQSFRHMMSRSHLLQPIIPFHLSSAMHYHLHTHTWPSRPSTRWDRSPHTVRSQRRNPGSSCS